jgi:predicted membrane protein
MSAPRARGVVDRAVDANASISAMAVLGAVTRGNNSTAFRGGELTAVLGGCEIDLRHAAINGEAVIEIFALWGGIDIRVPEDWTVVSAVVPVLGGVEDKTRPPQEGASRHRLVLRGFVVMAGVEIKN